MWFFINKQFEILSPRTPEWLKVRTDFMTQFASPPPPLPHKKKLTLNETV